MCPVDNYLKKKLSLKWNKCALNYFLNLNLLWYYHTLWTHQGWDKADKFPRTPARLIYTSPGCWDATMNYNTQDLSQDVLIRRWNRFCDPMKKKNLCDVAERNRGSCLLKTFLKPSLKMPSIFCEFGCYNRKLGVNKPISFFS